MRFRKIDITLVTLLFLVANIVGQPNAQYDPLTIFDEHKRWYNGFTEAWFQFFVIPENEVRGSIEHWEKIAKSKDPTSGLYGTGGNTHGTFVRLSVDDGFVWLNVDMCAGGPMKIIRGRVEKTNEGFRLSPEIELGNSVSHDGHNGKSEMKPIELIAVNWKESTYLVRKDALQDFSDFTAGLGDHNTKFAFILEDPFLKGRGLVPTPNKSDVPVYPKGYEHYLKTPVKGTIISIGKDKRTINPDSDSEDEMTTPLSVKIENGFENLKVGLYLHLTTNADEVFENYEIKSFRGRIATVHRKRSVPKKNCIISSQDDCSALAHTTLRPGLTLSSSLNWD